MSSLPIGLSLPWLSACGLDPSQDSLSLLGTPELHFPHAQQPDPLASSDDNIGIIVERVDRE